MPLQQQEQEREKAPRRNYLCKQIDIMFSLANQCVITKKKNAVTFMATIILLMPIIKNGTYTSPRLIEDSHTHIHWSLNISES